MNKLFHWVRLPLAACLLAGAAWAQTPDAPGMPQAGPPRPIEIALPTDLRLPNGLRVVVAQRPGVRLVTAELLVLSGAEADPPRAAGLASMTAALLTRGTQRHGANALARAAESLGGALESGAGWQQASVGMTVAVPKLDAALALIAEVVREPAFAPAEIERLRAQTLDELTVAYTQPGVLAGLATRRMLYGAGPYGHPAGGTPASLRRIGRADLVALHDARYRPDRAVLILAGDLDAASARDLAARHFGDWQAPPTPPGALADAAPNAPLAQGTTVIDLPQAGQSAVIVSMPVPAPGPERATAVVTNAVLGGGYSSRLNLEIRVRRGLSYGADSGLELQPGGGSVRAVVQTKNESAAEVVGLVQAELDRLATEPVGADELAARKAMLIGQVSRSVETTAGLAASVAGLVVEGRPLSDLRDRIDALQAVDPAAVQRYAAAHFGAAGRRVVVAGQAARFIEALRARSPGVVEVPARGIDFDAAAGLEAHSP